MSSRKEPPVARPPAPRRSGADLRAAAGAAVPVRDRQTRTARAHRAPAPARPRRSGPADAPARDTGRPAGHRPGRFAPDPGGGRGGRRLPGGGAPAEGRGRRPPARLVRRPRSASRLTRASRRPRACPRFSPYRCRVRAPSGVFADLCPGVVRGRGPDRGRLAGSRLGVGGLRGRSRPGVSPSARRSGCNAPSGSFAEPRPTARPLPGVRRPGAGVFPPGPVWAAGLRSSRGYGAGVVSGVCSAPPREARSMPTSPTRMPPSMPRPVTTPLTKGAHSAIPTRTRTRPAAPVAEL